MNNRPYGNGKWRLRRDAFALLITTFQVPRHEIQGRQQKVPTVLRHGPAKGPT